MRFRYQIEGRLFGFNERAIRSFDVSGVTRYLIDELTAAG